MAQLGVAARRVEVAEFDAERHNVDLVDAERAQLGGAAILAEGKDRIEAAIEEPAIAVANPAAAPASDRPSPGERPFDIDRREIGHIGRDQRRFGMALAIADRRPRQIIGVLAFDQSGWNRSSASRTAPLRSISR